MLRSQAGLPQSIKALTYNAGLEVLQNFMRPTVKIIAFASMIMLRSVVSDVKELSYFLASGEQRKLSLEAVLSYCGCQTKWI
jgi:hypothetical protein